MNIYSFPRDGSSRCGIFIAAYNMLRKYKNSPGTDLNVYEIVLELRERRPQFISTLVSNIRMPKLTKLSTF